MPSTSQFEIKTTVTQQERLQKRELASKEEITFIKEKVHTKEKIKTLRSKLVPTSKNNITDLSGSYKKKRRIRVKLKTTPFNLKGQSLQIAREYSAVHKRDFHNALGRRISSVSDYIIYKGTSGLPVVQDPIKKIKGHATGHIIVKLSPEVNLEEIVKAYDLEIAYVVSHLNLVSFTPRDKSKLLEISAKLSDNKIFDSVKLSLCIISN